MLGPKRLYVGLDAVMDLRLGVMNTISSDFALAVTQQSDYYVREEDIFEARGVDSQGRAFGKLSPELYASIMGKIPQRVLLNSLRTKINRFVRQLCATHLRNAIHEGDAFNISIDVNIWPFHVAPAALDSYRQAMATFFGQFFNVTLIDKSWEQLTPQFVAEEYFGMVLYTYADWYNHHQAYFKQTPLRNTCLYVPRLWVPGKKPPSEELELLTKRNMDPFSLTSQVLMPFLPIQFVPIAFFCADTRFNDGLLTEPVKT